MSKQERRILIRKDVVEPSSSSSTSQASTLPSIEGLLTVLENEESIGRWKVDKSNENKVRIELFDESHSIPKYTVVVDSVVFEFSVFVYQWPIPEDHSVYKQTNRSVRHSNIKELLRLLETSSLCEGLPDIDEIKNVVIDPITQDQLPGTIIRHSVPKNLPEEANFEVSVAFRSVDCRVVKETSKDQQKPCQPCSTALNATKRESTVGESPKFHLNLPKLKHHFLLVVQRNCELLFNPQDSSVSSWMIVCSTCKQRLSKMGLGSVYLLRLTFSK